MKVTLNEEALSLLQDLLETMDQNIDDADYYNQILSEGYHVDKDSAVLPIAELKAEDYFNNPYLKNIRPSEMRMGKWSLENDKYIPNQPFSYDIVETSPDDGYIEHTKFGYFTRKFRYLAIKENETTWMSITPHEINTMRGPINEARGDVLVLGLGLGYYPYMVSIKQNVKSVDVVEIAKEPTEIFKKCILPLFEQKDKIRIISGDAYEYMKNAEKHYDYVFVDLWHLPEDGLPLYTKAKALEKNDSKYSYWIESDMLILLRRAMLILIDEKQNNKDASFKKGNDLTEDLLSELDKATVEMEVSEPEQIMELISNQTLSNIAKNLVI